MEANYTHATHGSEQSFVHLHVHSEYSLLDGMIRIPQLVQAALAGGFGSIALTDHGGVHGLIPFYRQAVAVGLRPILGTELYVESPEGKTPFHLPVLAENNQGYQNLLKLVTTGYLEGFNRKPIVSKECLAEHSMGLIALSGCLQGEIPRLLRQEKSKEALLAAGELKEVFGKENVLIELQNHGLPEEKKILPFLVKVAKGLGLNYLATNDCHYLTEKDAGAHDLLLAVQTLTTLTDQARLSLRSREFYLKNFRQMLELFSEIPEALTITAEVAARCRVELELGVLRLPEFPVPEGFTPESYLRHLTVAGLEQRYPSAFGVDVSGDALPHRVRERLNKELSIINGMGMAGYFLIAWDLVAYAKKEGIPVGPGRGSGVGSLVAYLLGITQIDPVEYGLLFERFLNPERKGMPDLDIDLCHWGRPRVLKYLEKKYGQEHVAHLGAFVTLQPRAVIRDVGRALGVADQKIDQTAKAVPYYARDIKSALAASARLKTLGRDPEIRTVLQYAHRLQGLPRHMTQHAAGMVITPAPLTTYLALQNGALAQNNGSTEERTVITQAEMNTVEDLGLLKLDLLGLRNLTVIAETLSFLEKEGNRMTEEEIPLDDEQTFMALAAGDTIGVFQLESGGMRRLLRRYKPRNMRDIIAILALFRPGPLNSGMVETYIRRQRRQEPVEYLHPALRPILEETYGVILYQEQVMTVAKVLAGFSLGQADLLRKAISKRDPGALQRGRTDFLTGAKAQGVSLEVAEKVFALIQEFGHYGFAKAHSAAYALTAYRTAYLKTHYPVAYHAALLSLNWGDRERFSRYLSETRRKGMKILLPDINRSGVLFLPEKSAIRTGLLPIRDLGAKSVKIILNERKRGGPFLSLSDFILRLTGVGLSKKAVENLIKVGAFTEFGRSTQLLFMLKGLWKSSRRGTGGGRMMGTYGRGRPAQGVLFRTRSEEEGVQGVLLPEFSEEVRLNFERELLGNYFTKHPLEIVGERIKAARFEKFIVSAEDLRDEEKEEEGKVLLCGLIDGVRGHRTKKGERMFFAVLEDLTGLVDLVFFPYIVKRLTAWPEGREPCLIWGKTDRTGEEVSVIVEGIRPFHELTAEKFS